MPPLDTAVFYLHCCPFLLHLIQRSIDLFHHPLVAHLPGLPVNVRGCHSWGGCQQIIAHHLCLGQRECPPLAEICFGHPTAHGSVIPWRVPEGCHVPPPVGLLADQQSLLRQFVQGRAHPLPPLPCRAHDLVTPGPLAGVVAHVLVDKLFEGFEVVSARGSVVRRRRKELLPTPREAGRGFGGLSASLGLGPHVQHPELRQDPQGLLCTSRLCLFLVGGHGVGHVLARGAALQRQLQCGAETPCNGDGHVGQVVP
mmetsp:Transcript_99905/g.172265  ORF Transcript_99905/g.172265 Transcript_99905/m.172265 type:complete len:255 (+) Transcript_99905:805-1569(+)